MNKNNEEEKLLVIHKLHLADSEYRIKSAQYLILIAKCHMDLKDYSTSMRRSYEAIINTARALILLHDLSPKDDSDAVIEFEKLFVATGKIGEEFARYAREAWSGRSEAELAAGLSDSSEKSESQCNRAALFLAAAERFISVNYSENGGAEK